MALNDPAPYVDTPGGKVLGVVPFYYNATSGGYVASKGGRRMLYITGAMTGTGADITADNWAGTPFTLPAGLFANVGDTLYGVSAGSCLGDTASKSIKVTLGGTSVVSQNLTTAASTKWTNEFWVTKTGTNTQSYAVTTATNGSITSGTLSGVLTKAEATALDVLVVGQNATNATLNSVQCQFFMLEFIPAP